jgi:hypothetical protein
VLLVDERWRRRPVGIAATANTAGQPLLGEARAGEAQQDTSGLDPFFHARFLGR